MITFFTLYCKAEPENLIDGVKITGNKNTDLLLLLATTRETCTRISSSNKTIVFSGTSLTVCSNVTDVASITFPTTGNYKITALAGSQQLSASRCNSRTANFNVYFLDSTVKIASSSASDGSIATVTQSLSSTKTYTISNDGLYDPNDFRCGGTTPSSFVRSFFITFEKQ